MDKNTVFIVAIVVIVLIILFFIFTGSINEGMVALPQMRGPKCPDRQCFSPNQNRCVLIGSRCPLQHRGEFGHIGAGCKCQPGF